VDHWIFGGRILRILDRRRSLRQCRVHWSCVDPTPPVTDWDGAGRRYALYSDVCSAGLAACSRQARDYRAHHDRNHASTHCSPCALLTAGGMASNQLTSRALDCPLIIRIPKHLWLEFSETGCLRPCFARSVFVCALPKRRVPALDSDNFIISRAPSAQRVGARPMAPKYRPNW